MADSDGKTACFSRPLLAVIAIAAAVAASAASGFVSDTKVSRAGNLAAISISFNCNVEYVGHEPNGRGSELRIHVEPTSICAGVSPLAARTVERRRPADADLARLIDIEYDGESEQDSIISLNFATDVGFSIEPFTNAKTIVVRVLVNPRAAVQPQQAHKRVSRQVRRDQAATSRYAINLQSSIRAPATADIPDLDLAAGKKLMVSEVNIDGKQWYRLRVGYYESAEFAARALARFRERFPTAWIDREEIIDNAAGAGAIVTPSPKPATTGVADTGTSTGTSGKVAALMSEGKRLMTAGELSKAIQIYTKVLQQPPGPYHPAAQEYLALARERNGQIAHAKAEYERFLAVYPDAEGASRVRQRLAAMLSQPASSRTGDATNAGLALRRKRPSNNWNLRSYFSQYYRLDANQLDNRDSVTSQSALYSDVNVDARRRGERFDITARVTAGYRKDFLGRPDGDEGRVSYAFADVSDSKLNLRGRLGRQSRNSGGVLGRFDGFNLTYQATERLRLEGVLGKPVNSTADSIDDARTFYGISSNFGPIGDDLDLGVFFLQQSVEGLTDRQAIGAEMRYFGDGRSLWALADYDAAFKKLGSFFVQGSLRLPGELTLTGVFDQRRSPFLSLSNALIGQPVTDFAELLTVYTREEILQFALDRAAETKTTTIGVSRPISPKLQINMNASQSVVTATPESGGVFATPKSTYRFVTTDLIASSLLREGDALLVGLRYADSENTEVYTVTLDGRFPAGGHFRINPRLRVDKRNIKSDSSTQWIYTPGLRLQYRADRRFRLELEAGMQISKRNLAVLSEDRQSYFINIGYQLLY